MNISFYTAAAGAGAQQVKLDVIGNNMANVSTEGFKTMNAGFVDLLYENLNGVQADRTYTGSGSRVEKTDILFTEGNLEPTDSMYDYAIRGDGFFAVYDMEADQVHYTRKGNFHLSQYGGDLFYLADSNGNMVLDKEMGLIPIISGRDPDFEIGIFDFASSQGFLCDGNEYYTPSEMSGNPTLATDSKLIQGALECSNVDMSREMANIVETQRAYQMALRMVQTSDEIEQVINSLRG